MGEPPVPELTFAVKAAEAAEFAAAPTLAFALAVEASGGAAIRSLLLRADVRIALGRRAHDRPTRERLAELFGAPAQWASAPRSLPWTATTLVVPPFEGATTVGLSVACTYDFEVIATKYLHGVGYGDVPLEFLFSGSIFYAAADGSLRTARLPWDREAAFDLPVDVWTALMDHYFPHSAWLRLRKDAFDRLWAYKTRRALPTWEDAVEALLRESEGATTWTR